MKHMKFPTRTPDAKFWTSEQDRAVVKADEESLYAEFAPGSELMTNPVERRSLLKVMGA